MSYIPSPQVIEQMVKRAFGGEFERTRIKGYLRFMSIGSNVPFGISVTKQAGEYRFFSIIDDSPLHVCKVLQSQISETDMQAVWDAVELCVAHLHKRMGNSVMWPVEVILRKGTVFTTVLAQLGGIMATHNKSTLRFNWKGKFIEIYVNDMGEDEYYVDDSNVTVDELKIAMGFGK